MSYRTGNQRADWREAHIYKYVRRHHPATQLIRNNRLKNAISERPVDEHRQSKKQKHSRRNRFDIHKREQHQQRRERERRDHEKTPSPHAVAQRGKSKRAANRANPDERHEKTVPTGPRVKHIARNHRHECQILKSKNRVHGDHAHQPRYFASRPDVGDSLLELRKRRGLYFVRYKFWEPNRQQASNDGDVAQRVNAEAPRKAGTRNNGRGNRWSNNSREIESAGVQRHRIDDVLAAHKLDDKRLPSRNLDGADQSVDCRERNEQRDGDPSAPYRPPEHSRLYR